jgi:predicted RNase H-like HicB family nuclease
MKTMQYIAVIHKDKDSDWGVSFPDFTGCVTAGATIDEAKDNAKTALEFHIQGMEEDGETIPTASNLEGVMNDPDFADGVIFLVDIKRAVKSVRVNITIPENALDEIDKIAASLGKTRSAFLTDCALERRA